MRYIYNSRPGHPGYPISAAGLRSPYGGSPLARFSPGMLPHGLSHLPPPAIVTPGPKQDIHSLLNGDSHLRYGDNFFQMQNINICFCFMPNINICYHWSIMVAIFNKSLFEMMVWQLWCLIMQIILNKCNANDIIMMILIRIYDIFVLWHPMYLSITFM